MRKTSKKQFDPKLKLLMDQKSLWARQSFFEQHKCVVETNSIRETSGDFVVIHPTQGRKIVESEVKLVWTRKGEWQGYRTVDIPFRKNGRVDADWFIMLNCSCDTLCITSIKRIHQSPTYKKDTIYTKQEKFFAVEPDCFRWFVLNDSKNGYWDNIGYSTHDSSV